MPIIATTDTSKLEQIRKLVSIVNDTIDLPDETISEDVFLGDANLEIQREIPNWAEKTGEDETLLQILTMKQTAVNILVSFGRTTSEAVDDVSESRSQLTPAQAITRYELDITKGIKILNPSEPSISGTYVSAVIII